jgi:phosphoribosylformimino-5-aminoimidazole carboxamide ribotide isomerase
VVDLFPAIDLHEGVAVRLLRGDFSRQRTYGDPVDLARQYADGGARWIHVVDLDAARTGHPVNRAVVMAITDAVDVGIQVGGGVRSEKDAVELLDGGVARVVLGTAAVRDPDLVGVLAAEFPGQVVVGLDHRGGGADVAVAGWESVGGTTLADALANVSSFPLAAVVVTAIERDGTMDGPDLDGLLRVLALSDHDVVASGGVRGAADLVALARLQHDGRHLAGAIVGTALVEGTVDIEEAVAACAVSG